MLALWLLKEGFLSSLFTTLSKDDRVSDPIQSSIFVYQKHSKFFSEESSIIYLLKVIEFKIYAKDIFIHF